MDEFDHMKVKDERDSSEVKDECDPLEFKEESDLFEVKDECDPLEIREECDPLLVTTDHDPLAVLEDYEVQGFNDENLLEIEDNTSLITGILLSMMQPLQITLSVCLLVCPANVTDCFLCFIDFDIKSTCI